LSEQPLLSRIVLGERKQGFQNFWIPLLRNPIAYRLQFFFRSSSHPQEVD